MMILRMFNKMALAHPPKNKKLFLLYFEVNIINKYKAV